MSNPAIPQGFVDGFQVQLTQNCAPTDQVIFFPTAGMVNGFKYHMRIDDSNPPTTFEYVEVTIRDSGSAVVTSPRGSIGGTAAAQHNQGVNSGWVTCVLLIESLQNVFARVDEINPQALAASSQISGQAFGAYGLPGAVQPSRYVGATTGGAPTTGTFLQGDFVLDSINNVIFVCSVAGSPGTWVNLLDGTNTGLGNAVSSLTRFIGATGGGPPLTGTWKQGDLVTDRKGTVWICTAPGTPGTWTTVGLSKIDDILVGTDPRYPSATPQITFLNTSGSGANLLPTNFRHLLIEWYARGDTAAGNTGVLVRVNNTSTATYDQGRVEDTNNTVAGIDSVGNTAWTIGFMPANTATANYFGQGEAKIKNYNGAVGSKLFTAESFQMNADTVGSILNERVGGKWRTTGVPITRIDILPGAGNFIPGSLFTIYGIP